MARVRIEDEKTEVRNRNISDNVREDALRLHLKKRLSSI